MITLARISPENVAAFKATRLRALEDSPTAFGSTFTNEVKLSDADWCQRAVDWSNHRAVGYLAMEEGTPCGIGAAFLDEENPEKAHLVSMWVAPAQRGKGVGFALISAIRAWAKDQGARTLRLSVTSNNERAIEFYRWTGFR
jgi:ribosomal protein S18 acetylase RimI-like enzyme